MGEKEKKKKEKRCGRILQMTVREQGEIERGQGAKEVHVEKSNKV